MIGFFFSAKGLYFWEKQIHLIMAKTKKIGVLLSGSGVYDGSEIHEATLTLLAIAQRGHQALCMAPNADQHHVINHLDGSEMNEKRNVLTEAARIARGNIADIKNVAVKDLDALAIPGGFGAAKNLNTWALNGPDSTIVPEVQNLIQAVVKAKKPIVAMCMGPTVVAKALEGTGISPQLTVGTTQESSPYDIAGISAGLEKVGSKSVEKAVGEALLDEQFGIITTPCYMMEADINQIHDGIQKAFNTLDTLW